MKPQPITTYPRVHSVQVHVSRDINTSIQHATDLSAVKDTEEKNNVSLCHKLSLTAAVDVTLKRETYVTVG